MLFRSSRVISPDSFSVFTLAYIGQNQRCITAAPSLAFNRNNITICPGYPATINGRVNGYQFQNYLWSDGSTGTTFVAASAGKYWVTAWDSCGNAQTDTFRVKMLQTVKLRVDSSTCYGVLNGRITVLADTTNLKVWLNDQFTFVTNLGGLGAGTYNLKFRGPNVCSLDTVVTISEPPIKIITIVANPAKPEVGKEVTLTANPLYGFKPVAYQWSPETQMSCPKCKETKATLQDKDIHI